MFNVKMNNNSGMTFIDTLVSLVIFLVIILFIGNFQIFLKSSVINMDKKVTLLETINNEIYKTYKVED